jgi:hypothetical protein
VILVANDRIRSGVSNSLETDITLLLLWLLPVTEAATHVSPLMLRSSIGGIISESLYHVKWCPLLSNKLCSHSLYFIWFLYDRKLRLKSLNRLFRVI